MHAPLDDSAAELDPASTHRIEREHPVAVNLRRSLSPALDSRLHFLSLSIHRTRIVQSGLSDPGERESDMGVFV